MEKVLLDTPDILVTRKSPKQNHNLSLLKDIIVEPGDKSDWDLLHELHYKAETLPIGSRFWKVTLHGKTIGVGILAVPKMLLSGRNDLFKYLRPNVNGKDTRLINKSRAEWLNENVCTNSRLVLDTIYRGCGIAYRAQNLMMRMVDRKHTEFQSSMSKFNPFAERAGIKFTPPKQATNYQRGVDFFVKWFETKHPTDVVGILEELSSKPEPIKKKSIAEMRKFYYQYSSLEKSGNNRLNGFSRVESMPVEKLLKNIQQLVFASPLYGVYTNPDLIYKAKHPEHEIPKRVSILAFDCQKPDEPLNVELIKSRGLLFECN
ncbi:hypothetical protein [Acinetobacter baumannii]|uniref:hypothetical protein n=1 Tax=Acinetobacter baumannii TaxID=470 RepID=UPI0023EF9FE1|nr:hypothetical protein [Acinetobacter baumannii]MDF7804611.1 hypothetical protein [Acinetobacter baumannii]MDF7829317.1 hypothetical protein [Acinetobacter baumannii]